MSLPPKENPRRSKVKDALASEAVRFKDFDDFAKKYWLDCASGFYWYATNNENFHITSKEIEVSKAGRFNVACNPEFAILGSSNEGKKYVAEIDVTALTQKDFKVVRGADGTKFKIVSNLKNAKVTRVMEVDKALRSWKYQQSLLPSSKDQLRGFWKAAKKAKTESDAKEAAKKERTRKREARREERGRKKAVKKSRRPQGNPGGLSPMYNGPLEVSTKIGTYEFVGHDGDYDVYKIKSEYIGVLDSSVMQPEDTAPDDPLAWYSYNMTTCWEGEGPSIESVLDAAHRGPRARNPGSVESAAGPGVREVPSHVNVTKY